MRARAAAASRPTRGASSPRPLRTRIEATSVTGQRCAHASRPRPRRIAAGLRGEAVHGAGMLMIILLVLLVLALGGGGWGYSRYGAVGWSPAGLIVLVLVILLLTGRLHW